MRKKAKRFDAGGQVGFPPMVMNTIEKFGKAFKRMEGQAPGTEETYSWNELGNKPDVVSKLVEGLKRTKTMQPGEEQTFKKGGKVRGCGIAQRGRTKGRVV